jgi:RNA polymerase sigma factor (sigma-70 family)
MWEPAAVTDSISEAIQTYADALFRLVLRIVGDREEAKDLTQDVFVKVLSGAGRLREPERIKSYLFTTAYRRALNARRNADRRRQMLREVNPPTTVDSTEEALLLDRELRQLSSKQRQALTLRFYGDLTIIEIADAMGISAGSVKVHIARGLRNMKNQLYRKTTEEI